MFTEGRATDTWSVVNKLLVKVTTKNFTVIFVSHNLYTVVQTLTNRVCVPSTMSFLSENNSL